MGFFAQVIFRYGLQSLVLPSFGQTIYIFFVVEPKILWFPHKVKKHSKERNRGKTIQENIFFGNMIFWQLYLSAKCATTNGCAQVMLHLNTGSTPRLGQK